MTYGRWLPLGDALAPPGPGLLQVRYGQGAEGLIAYRLGRSAMVYYGGDDRELVDELARVHALARTFGVEIDSLWVRFAAPEHGQPPSDTVAKSRRQFADRFGTEPLWNQGGEG